MKSNVRRVRERIATLENRAEFLARRVASATHDLSFDKAELSALTWALGVLRPMFGLSAAGSSQASLAALPRSPKSPVDPGGEEARQLASEIVKALLAACDEHGPIAPRYSVEIVEAILVKRAAALRAAPTPEEDDHDCTR